MQTTLAKAYSFFDSGFVGTIFTYELSTELHRAFTTTKTCGLLLTASIKTLKFCLAYFFLWLEHMKLAVIL